MSVESQMFNHGLDLGQMTTCFEPSGLQLVRSRPVSLIKTVVVTVLEAASFGPIHRDR